MIKRILHFSLPAYLSKKDDQLVADFGLRSDADTPQDKTTIPIEDIGVVIIEHFQVTVTAGLLTALLENNTAVITCDRSHMPLGLFLPLEGNQTQNEHFRSQIEASKPLLKQLWRDTVKAKIHNQAAVLDMMGGDGSTMRTWEKKIRSGDPENIEGRAAAHYWKRIFPKEMDFVRDPDGEPPNMLLNYGYAILRAVIARNLVGSGLLPTLGIHHENKYNAYCLADDIMEPYRPFVDRIVATIVHDGEVFDELTKEFKRMLLGITTVDVVIEGERSPLMVGAQRTTSSLAKCFSGDAETILYPDLSHAV